MYIYIYIYLIYNQINMAYLYEFSGIISILGCTENKDISIAKYLIYLHGSNN